MHKICWFTVLVYGWLATLCPSLYVLLLKGGVAEALTTLPAPMYTHHMSVYLVVGIYTPPQQRGRAGLL